MNDTQRPEEGQNPPIEAVRRTLDALEGVVVQPHVVKDDVGRMLVMSYLHEVRIRRSIPSAPPFERDIGHSRAVGDGEWVFISATTGFDHATMKIPPDAREQAEQAPHVDGYAERRLIGRGAFAADREPSARQAIDGAEPPVEEGCRRTGRRRRGSASSSRRPKGWPGGRCTQPADRGEADGRMTRTVLAAILMCALLLPGTAAKAGAPPDAVARNDAALAAVDARARQDRAQGTMPRLSDPADRPALEALWDQGTILGKPPYRAADVPVLLDISQKQTQVFRTYFQFTPSIGKQPDPDANAALFQEELARSGAFLFGVSGALLQAFDDFWGSLPDVERTTVRRQGLHQARSGLVQMVTGVSEALRSPELRPGNAAVLADGLAASAALLAGGLTPKDRAALAAAVQPARAGVTSEVRAKLEAFVSAMRIRDCKGLCTVE